MNIPHDLANAGSPISGGNEVLMSDTTIARPGWQPAMLAGKSICTPDEAVADMKSGDTIAVGGFGTVRNRANQALDALARRDDVKDLIAVANGIEDQAVLDLELLCLVLGQPDFDCVSRPPFASPLAARVRSR